MSETLPLKTLLVDDEKNIRQTLLASLARMNCEATGVADVESALLTLRSRPHDFVLTDFKLGGKTGLDLIKATRTLHPAPVIVLMTAFASFENAVDAIKEGAFDYLPKPFSNAQLEHLLSKVRALVDLKRENDRLRSGRQGASYFAGMTSPAMERLQEFVSQVATTDSTVLISGESGTGKTELARVIHERSPRASGPFVIVNCTSLAETLLESELFGHVKGAFTGAAQDHIGKLELALHGTVFLDEVGDLSLGGQTKLLRFLQEKVIERVGSNRPVPVDARVIAATNRHLESSVHDGGFREDLYYRMNVFECALVPLRYRKEDLPVLIERFAFEFAAASRQDKTRRIPDPVMKSLLEYRWPGNIRELRNVMERLVILSRGRDIGPGDLPESFRNPKMIGTATSEKPFLSLDELEREHISRVLAVEHNQARAAETLGITKVTLWKKRKQYGLP